MDNMKAEIGNILLLIGIKPNHAGFNYIRDIIFLGISGKTILPLNGVGYTYIGDKYKIDRLESIDKDIQNAITYAWTYGDITYQYKLFGYTIDIDRGKPSNKQFILTIINYLLLNST